MKRPRLRTAVVAACACARAQAGEGNNLDAGHPLRLEDAYAIPQGQAVLELSGAFLVHTDAPDRFSATAEVLYGLLPNLQVGLGGLASTQPHDIDEQTRSGDLQLSALYNFNQETITWPALAAEVTLNLPTGVDSSGIDAEIKGIVTKSFGDVSLHLNAAYDFLSGTEGDEQDGRYRFAAGASVPVGAPMSTRTLVVADVFAEEGVLHGAETVGVEAGVRYQWTQRVTVDAGVGSEFTGEARSPLFVTVGLSVSF